MDYEAYLALTSNRNRKRWLVAIGFLVGVIIISVLPLLASQVAVSGYFLFMVLFIILGSVLMVYYIILPYFKQVNPPQVSDTVIEPQQPEDNVFFEEIRVTIIYWFTIPFFLLFLGFVPSFVSHGEYTEALYFLGSAAFFLLIALLFDKLIVIADPTQMKVTLGPLSDIFELDNIQSIRPTYIRPWREYMGFGKRVGPDGSLGYISPMNTAVRIELIKGKTYVITLRRTQELTNFVRYYRTSTDHSESVEE